MKSRFAGLGATTADSLAFFISHSIGLISLLAAITTAAVFVRSYIDADKVRKHMEKVGTIRGHGIAAGIGVATPFCSCSAVPVFTGFIRGGVPVSQAISFLVASPLVNEIAIIMLASTVGWSIAGVQFEYIPGKDRNWMGRLEWDTYLRDRLVALIDETNASIVSFDGVVPYPGIIAIKRSRPQVKVVWVRRGFWQNTTRRYLLSLQSKMMDLVVTPGDYGQAYDNGPTSNRKDSVLVKPISIYRPELTLSKEQARAEIGLDINRPAILVQLGIGEADLNSKMTAALKGLLSWPDLQVVLTKEPITSTGEKLAPAGLDIKIIRYFPLANILNAFDAAICAAGYNSVHEELAARIPTLFVPNIRGTDNQAARAKWAADNKMALTVDQSDLDAITQNTAKLAIKSVRDELASNCAKLPEVTGARDVARILKIIYQTSQIFQSTRSATHTAYH